MKRIYILLIAVLVVQMLLSLIAGPYSCDWGNEAYFYVGIFTVLMAIILPLMQKSWRIQKRAGFSFLFLLIALTAWVIGLFAGNFRIMCRLF